MATEAQIAANRRNASKSTGPRTEAGKEKCRLNALKHGGRAKVVDLMPVLPHEDPKVLEERIQSWLDDWQPSDGTQDDLARRGARLAYKLERSERAEVAYLAPRVRNADKREAARAVRTVNELGRRLYYDGRDGLLASLPKPPWVDDPELLVTKLEATAAGCRWLIRRWGQLRTLLDRGKAWLPGDVFRLFRLQGQNLYEADQDPELNGLLLTLDVISPGVAKYYMQYFRGLSSSRDPAFKWTTDWRELADRPADKPTAVAIVRVVIAERVERLECAMADLQEFAELEEAEAADRVLVDAGPAFERFARSQAALGRGLLRTVEELRRLRKDAALGVSGIVSPGPLHGQSSGPCHPEAAPAEGTDAACGCGGGSPGEPTPQEYRGLGPGASASTPPPQPRGEDDQPSADREVSEDENTTNEAKVESTQETTGKEVTSSQGRNGHDERTQSTELGGGRLKGETEEGDHESDESHESVGRRHDLEAAVRPRDTGNGKPQPVS